MTYPHGEETIKQAIERNIRGQLKEGERVLNTNIPEKLMRAAGLAGDQFVEPEETVQRKARQKKTRNKL